MRPPRAGFAIRVIYAVCLVGATFNHIRAVMAHGWFPADLPQATAAYWASLTFLDPLAAALLFIRPRAGIAASLAIILSDVGHNLWFAATYFHGTSVARSIATNPFLLSQMGFLVLVSCTAWIPWRELSREPNGQRVQ